MCLNVLLMRVSVQLSLHFKTTFNIIPYFASRMGGFKMEGYLCRKYKMASLMGTVLK